MPATIKQKQAAIAAYTTTNRYVTEIAKEANVTPNTVFLWVRSAGLPLRGSTQPSRPDIEPDIWRRLRNGESFREIALRYQTSRGFVQACKRRMLKQQSQKAPAL